MLLFTKTAGYRHPSISNGVAAMTELAKAEGLTAVHSEDGAHFTDDGLAKFAAVVFVSTSGDILNRHQQQAFERFVEQGGGFLGIHAASDTEYDWPWYGRLVGAYFSNHPLVDHFVDCHCFTADVHKIGSHPSTAHLPAVWQHRDEWYNFRRPPSGVDVWLTVDESTYKGGEMGPDHAISWSHSVGQGRAFYTALGHTPASYEDPRFRQHLQGALGWVVNDRP